MIFKFLVEISMACVDVLLPRAAIYRVSWILRSYTKECSNRLPCPEV